MGNITQNNAARDVIINANSGDVTLSSVGGENAAMGQLTVNTPTLNASGDWYLDTLNTQGNNNNKLNVTGNLSVQSSSAAMKSISLSDNSTLTVNATGNSRNNDIETSDISGNGNINFSVGSGHTIAITGDIGSDTSRFTGNVTLGDNTKPADETIITKNIYANNLTFSDQIAPTSDLTIDLTNTFNHQTINAGDNDIDLKTSVLVSNQRQILADKITFSSPDDNLVLNNVNSIAFNADSEVLIKHPNEITTSAWVNFANQVNNIIRLESKKIDLKHNFGSTSSRIKNLQLSASGTITIKGEEVTGNLTTGALDDAGIISSAQSVSTGQQTVTVTRSNTSSNQGAAAQTVGTPTTKTTSATQSSGQSSAQELVEQFDSIKNS